MTWRIMLVDDDYDVVEMNRSFLEGLGYLISCAYDGEECIEKLAKEKVDLLILDIRLPGIDGFEVCRQIRANPNTSRLGVIMLTAKKAVQDKVTGLEVGADDYLTKPFDMPELLARVKAQLRLRELQEKLIEMEKVATIGQMAITLSHEISNPLTSIIWHTRLLQEELQNNQNVPESSLVSLETIIEDAHRIEKALKRLRQISKPVVTDYTSDAKMIDLRQSLTNGE
jgi:two-component system sensor histidine kinase/response regulator